MSGGGFTSLSSFQKIMLPIVIIGSAVLSGIYFVNAFPIDKVLISILLIISGLVFAIIAIALLILILISK